MKKGTQEDQIRISKSKNAAKAGISKRNNKKTDNTRLYYIVIGIFVALCAYAMIEIFLNPKKSLSETPAIDQNKVSIHNSRNNHKYKQGFIDYWSDKSLADAKAIFQGGFSSSPQIQQCMNIDSNKENIPEQFDSHKNWPKCVSSIQNQGKCASGPMLQVASAMGQRKCIHQNGYMKELSAQAILACGQYRQDKKCEEAYANQAFYHMMEKGVAFEEDCPYNTEDLQCTQKCGESKFWAHNMCLLTELDDIRREIMTHGPVIGFINPTTDFLPYESGIYHEVDGQPFRGQHVLKIIGWTGNNPNEDSWIVQNTWGTGWGQEGKARVQMSFMGMFALKASVQLDEMQSDIVNEIEKTQIEEEVSLDEDEGKDESENKKQEDEKIEDKTESKKEEPKNEEPKKEEPKKEEPKKEEPKKEEPKKEEPKKEEPKKEEPKKEEPKKKEPKKEEKKNEPKKEEKKTEPKKEEPKKEEPKKKEPKKEEKKNEPKKEEKKTEPKKAEKKPEPTKDKAKSGDKKAKQEHKSQSK